MRIGIDARPLREARTTGIPMYVRETVAALARLGSKHEFILYSHKPLAGVLPAGWERRETALTPYGSLWLQVELPALLAKDNVDLFWGTQHLLPVAACSRVRQVLTVHDVVNYVHPGTMRLLNLAVTRALMPASVRRASRIVCISESTRRDLETHLPSAKGKTAVVPLGVPAGFGPGDRARGVAARFGLNNPFVLTVGTFEPRKNLPRLAAAFARVIGEVPHDLVIVGAGGWKSDAAREAILTGPLKGRVHVLGYVPDADMPALYRAADAFIFPSFYEGFGLPPLEAMACGTPLICSTASSLPEVTGDAAVPVDPFDESSMAAGLRAVLTDEALREKLSQAGMARAALFSWDRGAREIMALFEAAA